MKSYQRDMALSQGAIALHLTNWLDARFELPPVDVPILRHETSPEAAAEALRHHWNIGELPINNMIHLLESKVFASFPLRWMRSKLMRSPCGRKERHSFF